MEKLLYVLSLLSIIVATAYMLIITVGNYLKDDISDKEI